MTETVSSSQVQPRSRSRQELRKNANNIPIKNLHKTEDQNIVHPFEEGNEWEKTVKLANFNYSHGHEDDVMMVGVGTAPFVKSKLVKFSSNAFSDSENSNQSDNARVMFEKIPKIETIFLDDDDEPPTFTFSNEEDIDINCDANSDPEPERDPFADVDCDPSFSQKPQSHNYSDDFGTQDDELLNSADVNHSHSSNQESFRKNILPKVNTSKQNPKLQLQCLLCLEKQCSERKLSAHVKICKATHKNRHQFCFPCNHLFLTPSHYNIHVHRIHPTQVVSRQSLKCPFCSSSFILKKNLVSHLASHHNHESNSVGNTSHVEGETSKPLFNCPMPNCESVFSFNYNLRAHLKCAHSDQRQIKCEHWNCGKPFQTKDQLRRHMAFHSEERPLKCPHSDCSRTFKSKMGVASHLVLHTRAHRSKQTTVS